MTTAGGGVRADSPKGRETAGMALVPRFPSDLSTEDQENVDCLLQSYPVILRVERDSTGLWLLLRSGDRVFYGPNVAVLPENAVLSSDVRDSMRVLYPLEPDRPATPEGFAPGRTRPYAFLMALYGRTAAAVKKRIRTVYALRQKWHFVPEAGEAFLRAAAELEGKCGKDPSLRSWLKSSGTFQWRRIAGEPHLSAHSFGIAFDIGLQKGAAYWRWSPLTSHPMQKTFSSDIVSAFEKQGFIWGGKWHEYDIMHFEYRPELICKALRRKNAGASFRPGSSADVVHEPAVHY